MICGTVGISQCYRRIFPVIGVKVGDICLIRYKGICSIYRLGIVIKAKPGDDGLVRKVRVYYKLPEGKAFRNVDWEMQWHRSDHVSRRTE